MEAKHSQRQGIALVLILIVLSILTLLPDWLLLDLSGATYPMVHDQWEDREHPA